MGGWLESKFSDRLWQKPSISQAKQNVTNYIDINGPSLLEIYTFMISQLVVILDTITVGASQAITIRHNINHQ